MITRRPRPRCSLASSSSGGAFTGAPSRSRYAASSDASGAVKVCSPACGNGPSDATRAGTAVQGPLSSPRCPYTGSPTIGSRPYARWTRSGGCVPVTGRTCRSASVVPSRRVQGYFPTRRCARNVSSHSRPPARTTIRRRSSASRMQRRLDDDRRYHPGSPQTSARYSFRTAAPGSVARVRAARFVLRDDDHAARVLIEPVHDAWAPAARPC